MAWDWEKKKGGSQVACSQHAGRRMELDKLDLIRVTVTGREDRRRRWGNGEAPRKGRCKAGRQASCLSQKKMQVIEERRGEERRICSVSSPNAPAQFLHYITGPRAGWEVRPAMTPTKPMVAGAGPSFSLLCFAFLSSALPKVALPLRITTIMQQRSAL